MQGEPTLVILSLVRLGTGSGFLIYWSVVTIYVSASEIIDGERKIVGADSVVIVSVCFMVATYCFTDRSAGKIIDADTKIIESVSKIIRSALVNNPASLVISDADSKIIVSALKIIGTDSRGNVSSC